MSGTAGAPNPNPAPITPVDAVKKAIDNYANFEGRATRPEFWWVVLAVFVGSIITSIIDSVIGIPLTGILFTLAIIVPYLAVGARRLHDTAKSGWWLLIGLIPCVGTIVLIVLTVQPGTPGPNQYGPPPA